ncbi:MAG: hypothetical protein ACOX1S_12605 [Anaerostipes sp.]|jgi:O-antigen/teichoic acid export membrane protein
MMEMVFYGVGFFLVTILLQYILSRIGRNNKKSKIQIWTGHNTIIAICAIGIITNNIYYLAAILGFVIGDEVGLNVGWH